MIYLFQAAMEQIDTIAREVKALSTLINDLIEEQAADDPSHYRQRFDALLARYNQILASIDETSQRCTVIVPAKMIHENSEQLNATLAAISNAPLNFRDLADVRTAVQGQKRVCDVLDNFSHQVNELVTRADELLKQEIAPKYVQQDAQNIQKLYNEKLRSAHDLLEKLQVHVALRHFPLFISSS
jgi:AcrR family transcriptional regulator